jgi:hypothetical protein
LYKVEPRISGRARNLLAKDDDRAALLDDVEPCGPKVPLVSKPRSFACRAERLARARAGPYWSVVRPTGSSQGEGPDANTGEEMALGESCKVVRPDIFDTPFVYFARRDMPGGD